LKRSSYLMPEPRGNDSTGLTPIGDVTKSPNVLQVVESDRGTSPKIDYPVNKMVVSR
jgi:hypothetical protein